MKLWIATYTHRHGSDSFPLWCDDDHVPSAEEVIERLLDDFEDGEQVDVVGPMDVPTTPRFPCLSRVKRRRRQRHGSDKGGA